MRTSPLPDTPDAPRPRRQWLAACLAGVAVPAVAAPADGAPRMSTATARGRFTVSMTPQGNPDARDGVALGRMALSKTFEGDLTGTGRGEMLTALTPVQGSAGYVAIERVEGTLHGRAGSFVLQHSGSMDRGAQRLAIEIVPGSGTGALAGIAGVFRLRIDAGQHYYELDYTL